MPALFVHQVNDLLALQQAHQEAIDNGDGEQEARAALEDAQKTYVKEVEIGMRVEDKHGLTHKPKDMIEVAMLQGKQVVHLVDKECANAPPMPPSKYTAYLVSMPNR